MINAEVIAAQQREIGELQAKLIDATIAYQQLERRAEAAEARAAAAEAVIAAADAMRADYGNAMNLRATSGFRQP